MIKKALLQALGRSLRENSVSTLFSRIQRKLPVLRFLPKIAYSAPVCPVEDALKVGHFWSKMKINRPESSPIPQPRSRDLLSNLAVPK